MNFKRIAVACAVAGLVSAPSAQAHISIHPNTVPAGAFATLDVRVPGEQEGAHVEKVDMLLPDGFLGVDYEPVPGWSTKVIEKKLAQPVEEDGEKIDTEVSRIVWTWTGPLGEVGNGQFVSFPLSVAVPRDAAGKALEFRAVQTYSNGQVDRWIEAPLEAEHPAPRIDVTAAGGVIADVAGKEAGPAAGQSARSATASPSATVVQGKGGASEGLAVTALILGALGLATGLGALVAARRRGRRDGNLK